MNPDSRLENNGLTDPKRAQVERIAHSNTFRDRDPLKKLLLYLADRTDDGTADGLKEYTIGVEVFHKPETYDPQRDASVRQHIGKLRQKLDEYYRSEGVSDPTLVELPKRQFRLDFHDGKAPLKGSRRALPMPWVLFGCAVALLPLAYWFGAMRHGATSLPAGLDPAIRLLWQPFLESSKPTVISLGTPLFLRNKRIRLRDAHVNSMDAPESQARIAELQKILGFDSWTPSYEYTGIGEAFGVFDIARLFGRLDRQLAITRNSVLSWNEIRNENVIFLGSPKFNPHLRELPVELEFTIDNPGVTNVHPRPGEPATYERISDANGDAIEDHIVISRLPGINPSDRILVLGGMSTTSVWAAADYITHSETARDLVSRIKLPDGAIPPFFQVVLRCEYREMVPLQTRFVVFRELKVSKSAK